MSLEKEQDFKLNNSFVSITFSVFDKKLLFLHSQFTSSQFVLDEFGVRVIKNRSSVKVEFMFTNSMQAIGLYFDINEYDALVAYFKSLGYPVPTEDWSHLET